jgi:hypothetical protein
MPVVFRLEINGRTVALPDPAGGHFDAAGDIDRLLPLETQLPVSFHINIPTLGRVNAYGDVQFDSTDTAAIVNEATALSPHAKEGPEKRDVERLRALAEQGSHEPDSMLLALGD